MVKRDTLIIGSVGLLAVILTVIWIVVFNRITSTTTTISTPVTSTPQASPVPVPAEPEWLALANYDYSGNDMKGSPFINQSQDECTNLCQKTPGCVGAQYSPSTKNCWLKSKLGTATKNTDRVLVIPPMSTTSPVATWKKLSNEDHDKDDIVCYNDGSSADKCAALCALHGDCKAYNQIDKSAGLSDFPQGGCCVKKVSTPVVPKTGINLWSN